MFFLRICKRCEAFFNIKTQHVRGASTRAVGVTKENDQVLKSLGFSQDEYKKVLPKKRTIRELNLPRVVDMLNRLGFTQKEIRKQPNILWLHPFLIDHRFKLLEESGIERNKITLERISKFVRFNTKVISVLKKSSLLSQETDVVHNILGFSNLPVELYPPRTNDEECIGNAQTKALQTYIAWKLGLTMEEVKRRYQSYNDLHQKSIRLVMQSYEVLLNRLEIPEHKIKQNIYLLEGHPDNFLELLEKLPKIGDTKIQHVATTNPKILMRPVYKVLKVIEVLKKYNVTDGALQWYSNVLTLSPDTVKARAAALYADPVFNPFFASPQICFVICRYHTSISRYRLLSDLKWRCLSLSLLTQTDFHKHVELGHDESRSSDKAYYIKKHLGYGIKEINKQLRQHPFYSLIPLSAITNTLQLLLKQGFGKSDIFEALPIVLYPKEKVERWLQQVHSQPEVQSLQVEGGLPSEVQSLQVEGGLRPEVQSLQVEGGLHPEVQSLQVEGGLRPGLVLQLLLYYMERPYHFSGHGVWSQHDFNNVPLVK